MTPIYVLGAVLLLVLLGGAAAVRTLFFSSIGVCPHCREKMTQAQATIGLPDGRRYHETCPVELRRMRRAEKEVLY